MGKKRRVRTVSTAEGRRHLVKAEEFVDAASASFRAGRFTASGLESVHAVISAADAVTAHSRHEVSSAPDHLEVVHLLRDSLPHGLPAASERQLVGLLSMKSEIEYSGVMIGQARAKTMLDQAMRFVVWSRSILDESAARP